MLQYKNLVRDIMHYGTDKPDRTGTGTRSLVGQQLKCHLRAGFPLLTTKRVHFKSIVHELLWFLRGETNTRSLQKVGVTIWNEWADKDGYLGPIYGKQWRRWKGEYETHDQIENLIRGLKDEPFSRRHVVSAWNVDDLDFMRLAPCHFAFQFVVDGNSDLHCIVSQRSADVFLGVPFNIASYALLTHMVAQVCGFGLGSVTLNFGDVHLYKTHFDQATELLKRAPYPLPKVHLDKAVKDIFEFQYDNFLLENYVSHAAIKAEVAV